MQQAPKRNRSYSSYTEMFFKYTLLSISTFKIKHQKSVKYETFKMYPTRNVYNTPVFDLVQYRTSEEC